MSTRPALTFALCVLLDGVAIGQGALGAALIRAHVGTELVAIDEAGRTIETSTVAGLCRSIAVDGIKRTWATFDGGRIVIRDPSSGSVFTVNTGADVGPIAIDAAGNAFTANPTVGSSTPTIRRFDASAVQTASWSTFGWVQQIVIDSAGRVVTLETPTTGSSRVRAYDAVSGALLFERAGCALQSRIWPRPGGGFVVTQLDDATIAPWSGFTIAMLDTALQTIGGFSTSPEFLPTHVVEGLDGRIHAAHGVSTTGTALVRTYATSGAVLAEAGIQAGPRSLTLDGKGRLIVSSYGAHATGGSPVVLDKFDRNLVPFWSASLGTTTNLGTSRMLGDPTGLLYCLVTDPGGDLDGDARPNGAELAAGTDPLDPLSTPASITPSGSLTPGATYTLDLNAPEDAGMPYQWAWTFSGEATPLAMIGGGDWRSIELSPIDATGGLDLLYLYSTTLLGAGLFTGTSGTLSANGSATTTVTAPSIGGLSGTRVYGAFVTFDPGSPSGVRTISKRHTETIN